MEPLRRIDSIAVPLGGGNIDTDQILPARFLQKPRSCNFGEFLFQDVRQATGGGPRADFPLNHPLYADARILVAGRNFGCGSSREHAVWALYDGGFRAVIAPSFGDIFRTNALKNGLLPVQLAEEVVDSLLKELRRVPGTGMSVDLVEQLVTVPGGGTHDFAVDSFARQCLIGGIDELDYTLSQIEHIRAYEDGHDDPGPAA